MKVLEFTKCGNPLDVLSLEDIPNITPNADEVLIKMKFCPINPSDLYYIMGEYGLQPSHPAIPGFEGMGVVESIGRDIVDLKVGTRVIPLGIRGTWREYIIAHRDQFIIVPAGLKDEIAAQLIINPMTAWILAIEELKMKKDQWLLQTAAGSTVGRLIIQISKLKGFKTINFVRREAQVQELLDLGAESVICTKDKDIIQQVMNLTTAGADGGIDAVGGKTGATALKCLKRDGTLIVYGLLSLSSSTPIDTGEMIFKETTIKGFWLTRWYQKNSNEIQKRIINDLMQAMIDGTIEPPIEAIYDINEFDKAIAHSTRSGKKGKVLLKIGAD